MKRKMITITCIATILGISYGLTALGQSAEKPKKELLRVGVYDSRAIVLAYKPKFVKDNLEKMQTELKQAEKNHDIRKMKELMTQAQKQQLKANWQGMGIEPVHECFDPIRDKIPAIAQQAGVDIIINKWSMDYTSEEAGFIDLTDELVQLYDPDKGTLKWIESIKKTRPLSAQLNNLLAPPNKKAPEGHEGKTAVMMKQASPEEDSRKSGDLPLEDKLVSSIKPPYAIVTEDAAVFQFLIEDVNQQWKWDNTYDMALEYTWHVEITFSEKVYDIGYSHFKGPGSKAKQGSLSELLVFGQVDVWDQGRSVLRGKGLSAELNEYGMLIRLTDLKFLDSIIREKPEKVIFKSEGWQLKKNNKQKREEMTVQYQLND